MAEHGSVPLAPAERAALDRALRRLHEALRDYWNAWPIARRTPSQVSRELSIDRTTCQRVSALVRARYSCPDMLEGMPGPRALRALIEAAADGPPDPRTLDRFSSAVDAFDEVLRDLAGSITSLKRRMSLGGFAPEAATPAGDDAAAREALFHAAHALTRRQSLATASVGLYDRVGVGVDELRHVRVSGNHGIVAAPDAVPMVLEAFEGPQDKPAADGWQRTPRLLESLTSAEWRSVELRPSTGFASTAVEIARSEEPSDVYIHTAFPVPDPRTLDEPIEESWFVLYSPTRTLIFDLYLHESIARRCLVSLDVHLWQTSFANAPHGRWHTRMPQAPAIVQLGRGIDRAATPAHPRHVALTRELFRRADADPAEYVGFRCEEPFPTWRSGYRFELDFGDEERAG